MSTTVERPAAAVKEMPPAGVRHASQVGVAETEGYEKVSVKAGTFNAFRIGHYQENRRVNPPRMLHATHWWSPEARAFVKRVSHSTGWGRDFELELYTLK